MKITKLKQYKPLSSVITYEDRAPFIYCSATTKDMQTFHGVNWRKNRYGSDVSRPYAECRRHACCRINDKPFCAAHAGRIALDLWLRGDLQNVGRSQLPVKEKPAKTPPRVRKAKPPRMED